MQDGHNIIVPRPVIPDNNLFQADENTRYGYIVNKILSGHKVSIKGSYSSALSVYSKLKKQIGKKFPVNSYSSSRIYRHELSNAAARLLVEVKNGEVSLERFPQIGWLREFYAGMESFYLSFPDVLGLNGAWQWYLKGVSYSMLDHRIHPFYGVYFPTRTNHLVMFDRWLRENARNYKAAIDVGTGSGVLSFIMLKHGIKNILSTDINPNSIYGLKKELKRLGFGSRIRAEKTNLFETPPAHPLLVVFNPPWIPGNPENEIDRGIYFHPSLFRDFFDRAFEKLGKDSVIAIFFSNFFSLAGLQTEHPLEKELKENNRFRLAEKKEMKASRPSKRNKNKWLHELRKKEKTELWILKRI